MEVNKLCRLCLCKGEDLVAMFESPQILHNIQSIFKAKFENNSELPGSICTYCESKLNEFSIFYKMVVDNQVKLQDTKVEALIEIQVQVKVEELPETVVIEPYVPSKPRRGRPPGGKKRRRSQTPPEVQLAERIAESKADSAIDPELSAYYEQEAQMPGLFYFNKRRPRVMFSHKYEDCKYWPLKQIDKTLPPVKIFKDTPDEDCDEDVYLRRFYTFSCHRCPHRPTFDRFNALQHHTRISHYFDYVKVQCCQPDCFMRFWKRNDLFRHTRKHENEVCQPRRPARGATTFTCDDCNASYNARYKLTDHFKRGGNCCPKLKPRPSFICEHCFGFFKGKGTLNKHFRDYHGFETGQVVVPKNFICESCTKRFRSLGELEMHIKVDHRRETEVICEVCAKVCKNPAVLRRHMEKHTDTEKQICTICGSHLTGKIGLRNHMTRVHRNDEMPCELCGKVLGNKAKLKQHIFYVHQEKRYRCPQCNLGFMKWTKYQEHVKKHTNEV